MTRVPFNRPYTTGAEFDYLREAIEAGHLSGNGGFTRRCHEKLIELTGSHKVLLTHSCTAALEMTALLAGLEPGDEVIMPSYTFVSTANAFVLRGAVPVFVDIDSETLNIDPALIETAVTTRTRAICVVHYAGVGCDMERVQEIAERHGLMVIEDAAQGVMASRAGRALGSIGQLGALSFHETKNLISGEGGALLINDPALAARAEIIWEKGTNRSAFFRGEIDKYTWVDVGSSFLPSELTAAFLWAQLEQAENITSHRLSLWERYWERLAEAENRGLVRRPIIPAGTVHNAHMFYVITQSHDDQVRLLSRLRGAGYLAVFHYVPLHSSPAGRRFARTCGPMTRTDDLSTRLVRLPLWVGLSPDHVDRVSDIVSDELGKGQ